MCLPLPNGPQVGKKVLVGTLEQKERISCIAPLPIGPPMAFTWY
jgi:hypothetical protein